MSETITFDTHRFVKRMVETGMSEQTAEALADEHMNLLESNLATRHQLATVDADLKARIAELDARLTGRISEVEAGLTGRMGALEVRLAETESRLMRWMVGLLIAQGGAVVSLIKLL